MPKADLAGAINDQEGTRFLDHDGFPVRFEMCFEALTGNHPFPWQRALFREFASGHFRRTCDVPTGLGKTSVMAVWLLALVSHLRRGTDIGFPRRLIYVVNRRTVVDQATREAERMRSALVSSSQLVDIAAELRSACLQRDDVPFGISTLRGQFADNAEWRNDPTRPAVVVGTVDMIGSRLLFSGYGCGFKSRPLHAGLLGADSLIVHDEAHLEPAFQELLTALVAEQHRSGDFRSIRAMELTATSRSVHKANEPPVFTSADLEDERVRRRVHARKGLALHAIGEERQFPEKVVELALRYGESDRAVVIFLRRLEHVETVAERLTRANRGRRCVQTLTGTLRGYERDRLARTDAVFARFMPRPEVTAVSGSVFLVCTSAGEVGVDISADHLICDLAPFDSMAQRFGRVNRFGDTDSTIDVVHTAAEAEQTSGDSISSFERARRETLALLQRLPVRSDGLRDASPAALRALPLEAKLEAFSPSPAIRVVTDVLLDSWALTSVREHLPGRPPVAPWLHGVAEWEAPETYVAWRQEVELVGEGLLDRYSPRDLLEDYPLKPHELLRDRSERVRVQLEKIARRQPDAIAWLIDADGVVEMRQLRDLSRKDKQERSAIDYATVVLAPVSGGLTELGTLDGDAEFEESRSNDYDIADRWPDPAGQQRRQRVWDDDPVPRGMRLVRAIELPGTDEDSESESLSSWRWYVRPSAADDDGSRSAAVAQELTDHLLWVEAQARDIVHKLRLPEPEATAVVLAARWHDLGKRRRIWQYSIGNRSDRILAKSGPDMRPVEITPYRHEFGSLLDVPAEPEFLDLDPDVQDLVLHLVAAHHGRARPHFPEEEAFDPECSEEEVQRNYSETPRRFARLQQKYGRWGLAYLESLVRTADMLASQALRQPNQEANVP